MKTEDVEMLAWAFQHPFLYTIIMLKAAIVSAAVASVARSYFKYNSKRGK